MHNDNKYASYLKRVIQLLVKLKVIVKANPSAVIFVALLFVIYCFSFEIMKANYLITHKHDDHHCGNHYCDVLKSYDYFGHEIVSRKLFSEIEKYEYVDFFLCSSFKAPNPYQSTVYIFGSKNYTLFIKWFYCPAMLINHFLFSVNFARFYSKRLFANEVFTNTIPSNQ